MFHVEHRASWWDIVVNETLKFGISINEEVLAKLSVYLRELRNWNRKINLSGFDDPEQIAIKHFLDSLAGAMALKDVPGGQILDVGSGAGFPGLPLKLIFPKLPLRLLEPNTKKTAFLRHLIGTLGLEGVAVSSKRVQDFADCALENAQYSAVVTRAVKPNEVLSAAVPLLSNRGRIILWRTESLEPKQLVPGLRLETELTYTLPGGYGDRKLSILLKSQ